MKHYLLFNQRVLRYLPNLKVVGKSNCFNMTGFLYREIFVKVSYCQKMKHHLTS